MRALAPLGLLVLLLPFEPIAPVARGFGLEVSFLELAAFVLLSASAVALARRGALDARWMRLGKYAAVFLLVCFVSSYFAEPPRTLPLKFSLRVSAGVVAFLLTSCAVGGGRRTDLLLASFAASGALVAVVALLEAASFPLVDSLVVPFREHDFEVGGQARVAATFVYPNVAAGFLLLTLPPALFFVAKAEGSLLERRLGELAALAMFAAILLSFSRGALLGAFAGAACYWLGLRRRGLAEARRLFHLLLGFVALAVLLGVVEPAFRWRAATETDRSWYRAAIEPEERMLELEPKELATTTVSVRNTGRLTWSSDRDRPFHLSYRWFTLDREKGLVPVPLEGERTPLARPLDPGESAELRAVVRAPARPGDYLLAWDMVHEHTTWFSDKTGLGMPVQVRVERDEPTLSDPAPRVDPSDVRKTTASRAWHPGRRELWALAWKLFRNRPLLGVGPDNFRWLYGERAGRTSWDTRTFSNSLYLELASTTGLLGLLAFVSLAGATLLGLARGASSSPVVTTALGASLVGFLIHGVFDYLLFATPIYLAFWMLIGVASAVLGEEGSP